MKVNDDIYKSIKNLTGLVEESTKLNSLMPSLIDSLVKKVPQEQREQVLQFVQASNELLDKSAKVDFNDVQSLIKHYKLKYEQGNNHRKEV